MNYIDAKNEADKRGERNDCAVKALAIAAGMPYGVAHLLFKKYGRKDRRGTRRYITKLVVNYLKEHHGFTSIPLRDPRKADGSRFTMKTIGQRYYRGRYLVFVSGHVAAMIDGKIEDWTEGRRHRVTEIWSLEQVEN